MTVMPSFHRYPSEAAIIGRLLVAFGELEFMLALCAGVAVGNRDIALKTLFRLRSESSRIEAADALMRETYQKASLGDEYADMLGAVRHCLRIRNQFAHCHWADDATAGLFFTNLQLAADAPIGFEYAWRHVDVALLETQEQFFEYATRCLLYLESEMLVRQGRCKAHAFAMPPKRLQPNLHNLPEEHAPPWKVPLP